MGIVIFRHEVCMLRNIKNVDKRFFSPTTNSSAVRVRVCMSQVRMCLQMNQTGEVILILVLPLLPTLQLALLCNLCMRCCIGECDSLSFMKMRHFLL